MSFDIVKMVESASGVSASVLPVFYDLSSNVCRQLFVTRHRLPADAPTTSADSIKPTNRTLVVYGVPGYCDDECMEVLFNGIIPDCVHSVIMQSHASVTTPTPESTYFASPRSHWFQVAYVVLHSAKHAQRLLSIDFAHLPREKRLLSTPDHSLDANCGMQKWCDEYKQSMVVNPTDLQRQIDDFMADYDDEQKRNTHTVITEPDEDGWQTVVAPAKRQSAAQFVLPKYGQTLSKLEADKNAVPLTKRAKKKKRLDPAADFYKFQVKQSKMKHLDELRRKFEEDKKKIAMMKATRKFKPQ